MPNLEQPKQKTLESIPSPSEAKEILGSYKKLGDKMTQVDSYLRTIEDKLQNDTTLRKDEKVELEQIFNEIETQKKHIAAQMNTPAARVAVIDDKLRELEAKMESSEFRKDEKEVFNTEFNTLEQKKKGLLSTPEDESVPDIKNITTEPEPVSPVTTPPTPVTVAPTTPIAAQAESAPVQKPAPASENPEPAPAPAPAPTKTPEQLLAEKLRRGESLTPEDYLLRKDKWSGPGGVAKELENLATAPDSQEAHNFIEHTGPNLERSRKDYVLAIFNNRKALYENKQWKDSGNGVESETLDPANQEYLKILQKKYNDNIDAELAQITVAENPEGGKRLAMTKARLEFLENERNTFNNELFMLENEETKKRINRALDKAFSKAGEFIGNAGAFAGKKINNILDRFKNKQGRKKGDGMPWWYYAAMVPASPTMLGVWAGDKLHKGVQDSIAMLKEKFNKTMNPEKKEGGLKEKYGNKKRSAEPVPGKPLDKAQEQKVVEARKKEFLEKVTGVELTGRNLDNWKKLGIVHVGKFFNLSRFKKPTELEQQKTYPMQQKIYTALLPAYEEAERTSKLDRTKDIKGTDKLSMEEFITKLAEQDKLKALWTKASSNNS